MVVATDTNSHKAQGGRRVMYTTHHPCWDAKNRHGLPEEMELSYSSIAPIFGTPAAEPAPSPSPAQLPTVTPETLAILNEWMNKAGIEPHEIPTLVSQKGHCRLQPDRRRKKEGVPVKCPSP